MSAILFGSISALADTSEMQRRAFNDAFAAHDLDWNWTQKNYIDMLGSNGGATRIAEFAASRGDDVDADAVHATKSTLFRKLLAENGVEPRPGVAETIAAAKSNDVKLGFVTTTSKENVAAILSSLSMTADSFDVVVDADSVEQGKPDPAAYLFALGELGEDAKNCVAIEDNEGGVESAVGADIACIAFPNQNTAGFDFAAATERVDVLDPEFLRALTKN